MTIKPALFVETNFLVGHARGEDQAYETIVAAAEAKRIELIVPVFCFYEALEKFRREREPRERWAKDLDGIGKELGRKNLNLPRARALQEAAEHLRQLGDDHRAGLSETTRRVRACALLVALGSVQLADALEFEKYLEGGGDPWVGASLRQTLAAGTTPIFLTKDSKFADMVEVWSAGSEVPLLKPFAGLVVHKHPAAVVAEWALTTQTPT